MSELFVVHHQNSQTHVFSSFQRNIMEQDKEPLFLKGFSFGRSRGALRNVYQPKSIEYDKPIKILKTKFTKIISNNYTEVIDIDDDIICDNSNYGIVKKENEIVNTRENNMKSKMIKNQSNLRKRSVSRMIETVSIDDDEDEQKCNDIVCEDNDNDECMIVDDIKSSSQNKCIRCFSTLSFDHKALSSKDFFEDPRCYLLTIERSLRDKKYKYYKEAIEDNQQLFKGKIVLNCYCGIGLLTLFALKAGASKVIAIDSSQVIEYAKSIIENNGYKEKVKFIFGQLRQIQLPIDQVDVILCDWTSSILFNIMIPSVIYARDKWLKPNGIIFPDYAKLKIFAVGDFPSNDLKRQSSLYTKHIKYWDNVYGFNYDCVREVAVKEPTFHTFKPRSQITDTDIIKVFDLYKLTIDDVLNYSESFELECKKDDYITMLGTYFNVDFVHKSNPKKNKLSTKPDKNRTWNQMVYFMDEQSMLTVKNGDFIYGKFLAEYQGDNQVNAKIDVKFKNEFCQVDKTFDYLIKGIKRYF